MHEWPLSLITVEYPPYGASTISSWDLGFRSMTKTICFCFFNVFIITYYVVFFFNIVPYYNFYNVINNVLLYIYI